MYEQKCYILAAQVILPQDIVLCKEGNEDIYNPGHHKEPTCHIIHKEYDGRYSQIELNQVPDHRVYLIAQPRDQVLQALLLQAIKKEAYQTQDVQQNDYDISQRYQTGRNNRDEVE